MRSTGASLCPYCEGSGLISSYTCGADTAGLSRRLPVAYPGCVPFLLEGLRTGSFHASPAHGTCTRSPLQPWLPPLRAGPRSYCSRRSWCTTIPRPCTRSTVSRSCLVSRPAVRRRAWVARPVGYSYVFSSQQRIPCRFYLNLKGNVRFVHGPLCLTKIKIGPL